MQFFEGSSLAGLQAWKPGVGSWGIDNQKVRRSQISPSVERYRRARHLAANQSRQIETVDETVSLALADASEEVSLCDNCGASRGLYRYQAGESSSWVFSKVLSILSSCPVSSFDLCVCTKPQSLVASLVHFTALLSSCRISQCN